MRGARPGPAGLVALIAWGLGCAHPGVWIDADADLAVYRTWSWRERSAGSVVASHRDEGVIGSVMERVVEQALAQRGFVHVERNPDFLVGYELELERRIRFIDRPQATRQLSSLHSTPSYVVEGGSLRERVELEQLRLSIRTTDPTGRALWSGKLDWSVEDGRAIPVTAAIEALFEHVGRAGSGPSGDGPSRLALPDPPAPPG